MDTQCRHGVEWKSTLVWNEACTRCQAESELHQEALTQAHHNAVQMSEPAPVRKKWVKDSTTDVWWLEPTRGLPGRPASTRRRREATAVSHRVSQDYQRLARKRQEREWEPWGWIQSEAPERLRNRLTDKEWVAIAARYPTGPYDRRSDTEGAEACGVSRATYRETVARAEHKAWEMWLYVYDALPAWRRNKETGQAIHPWQQALLTKYRRNDICRRGHTRELYRNKRGWTRCHACDRENR